MLKIGQNSLILVIHQFKIIWIPSRLFIYEWVDSGYILIWNGRIGSDKLF